MKRTRRGSTFIITLGVIAGLLVVVAAIAGTVRLNARARINGEEAKRARIIAMSGVQYAFSVLQGQPTASVGQTDGWATLGCTSFTSPGDTVFQVADGFFRVQIVDGCSLININTASATQLDYLPLTQEQVDSLTDWRSAGETAKPDGAKDAFYNGLPQPYNAKLGALDTIDELLQVQYFTRDVIYDTPTITGTAQATTGANGVQLPLATMITVDATAPVPGAGGISVRTGGGNAAQLAQQLTAAGLPVNLVTLIVARRPFTTYAALLRLPGVTNAQATIMLNRLSVSAGATASNRINVNTANQSVLQTLPGLQSDVATAIVTGQSTPLTSLGSLMSVPGITVANATGFIDSVSVGSQTFLVRVVGWVGSTTVSLEATVSITGTTAKIIKIVDQPFPNMDVRWNWADASSTNMLVDPTQVKTQ